MNYYIIKGKYKIVKIKEWINSNLLTKSGKINRKKIIPDNILNEFNNLLGSTLDEKIYILLNDLEEIPKCIICGISSKFLGFPAGYKKTCSNKCRI